LTTLTDVKIGCALPMRGRTRHTVAAVAGYQRTIRTARHISDQVAEALSNATTAWAEGLVGGPSASATNPLDCYLREREDVSRGAVSASRGWRSRGHRVALLRLCSMRQFRDFKCTALHIGAGP